MNREQIKRKPKKKKNRPFKNIRDYGEAGGLLRSGDQIISIRIASFILRNIYNNYFNR